MCAASPSSTTLPCRQVPLVTVAKLVHFELLARIRCPSRTSPSRSPIRAIESSSLVPGANTRDADAANPARRQTSSCISTMKVLPVASYG